MARLVMVLCPPRSFSTLVSTMIGQHPDIYGFPELVVMVRETVGEALRWSRQREKFLGPPGLLRAMAELMYGSQSAQNVMTAYNWLEDRSDWKSKEVIDFIMDRAEEVAGTPYCLEKSPVVATMPVALERIRRAWPDALYIHLTRHPVNFKTSLDEFIQNLLPHLTEEERQARLDRSMSAWPVSQRNIMDFCASLAPGQYIRIRGEDVLSDGYSVMRQVAEWLGVRTDHEAISAMLRPEESPYAKLGPMNAPHGNDPKFISSPKFRPGAPRLGSLKDYFETVEGRALDPKRQAYLMQLANCLGYQ